MQSLSDARTMAIRSIVRRGRPPHLEPSFAYPHCPPLAYKISEHPHRRHHSLLHSPFALTALFDRMLPSDFETVLEIVASQEAKSA